MNRKRIFLIFCLMSLCVFICALTAAAAPQSQIEIENISANEDVPEDIQIVRNTDDAGGEQAEPAVSAEEPAPAQEEPAPEVPAPGVPVPQAPKGSTASREIGFYWTPAENAEHYEVHWRNDQGNEFTLKLDGDDWTCRAGRCIIYEELPINDNYTWTVSAVNESGSAVSEELSFSVLANIPAPTAYLPNTTLGSQKPLTFQWDDVRANAREFRVQVMDSDSGRVCFDRWYPIDQMLLINGMCILDTDEYLSAGSYAWRVMERNDLARSNWSGWTAFSVKCNDCELGTYLNTTTAAIAPKGMVTDNRMTFYWQTVTGAFNYQLKISRSDGTEELLDREISPENCTIDLCSFTPELEFETGESYEWTVITHGWNNVFWGSDSESFTVAALTVMNAVEFYPLPENTALDADNQQIVWTDPGQDTASFRVGVSGADGEWLFVGDLTREEAWCDGLTCSIQFRTIPEGEHYAVTVIPYSEFNLPGEAVTMEFNNTAAE